MNIQERKNDIEFLFNMAIERSKIDDNDELNVQLNVECVNENEFAMRVLFSDENIIVANETFSNGTRDRN